MARPSIRAAMLALLAVASMFNPVVAAPAPVPGTRVELEPPEGFTPSRRFPGFEHLAQGASIMVNEVPAGYAELRAGFTREGLASRGMRLIEMKDVAVAGAPALLFHVTQQAAGIDFRKWMLLAPRGNESVLVVGTFPRTAPAPFGEAVRLAVLSTSTTTGQTDPIADLPFHVHAGSRLKVAQRMGNTLVLTPSGSMARTSAQEPLYVIGPSVGRAPLDNLQHFAEQRAQQTVEISGLRAMRGRNLKAGRARGVRDPGRCKRPAQRAAVALLPGRRARPGRLLHLPGAGRQRHRSGVPSGVPASHRVIPTPPANGHKRSRHCCDALA